MAKKKKYRTLPKRIAGVKLPKSLRRVADTPLGGALIAVTLVELGKEVFRSPAMQSALSDVRSGLGRAGLTLAAGVQQAATAAGHAISDVTDGRGKRRGGGASTPRLSQDEATAH